MRKGKKRDKRLKMKNSFFEDKKILITGVNWFVGSNLAKNLTQLGAKVVGLSKSKKKDSLLFYEKIDKNIDVIFGDITDSELLKSIISVINKKSSFIDFWL